MLGTLKKCQSLLSCCCCCAIIVSFFPLVTRDHGDESNHSNSNNNNYKFEKKDNKYKHTEMDDNSIISWQRQPWAIASIARVRSCAFQQQREEKSKKLHVKIENERRNEMKWPVHSEYRFSLKSRTKWIFFFVIKHEHLRQFDQILQIGMAILIECPKIANSDFWTDFSEFRNHQTIFTMEFSLKLQKQTLKISKKATLFFSLDRLHYFCTPRGMRKSQRMERKGIRATKKRRNLLQKFMHSESTRVWAKVRKEVSKHEKWNKMYDYWVGHPTAMLCRHRHRRYQNIWMQCAWNKFMLAYLFLKIVCVCVTIFEIVLIIFIFTFFLFAFSCLRVYFKINFNCVPGKIFLSLSMCVRCS